MIIRSIGGSLIAAFITVWLFLLMRYLILPDGEGPKATRPSAPIILTRDERPEHSPQRNTKKPPRPVKQEIPPPPLMMASSRPSSGGEVIELVPPEIIADDNTGTIGLPDDRRAIPVVKFPPQYPSRPLSKGIEGWVLLEFTITAAGTVEDLVVLDSEPPNAFEKSATSAVKRWKYQPKVVNGKPVPQHKMQELITYVIEE